MRKLSSLLSMTVTLLLFLPGMVKFVLEPI